MNHRTLKWVRGEGLPSLDEIQRRTDAVRPLVAPPFAAQTILVALIAREWRRMGLGVAEVAVGLADERLGLVSGPISQGAAEQRLKRAEAMLRRLERAEGKAPQPGPADASAQQKAANAYERGLTLRRTHGKLLVAAKARGDAWDQDAALLLADAAVLEQRADTWELYNALSPRDRDGSAQRDDREELRRLAAGLRWRAQAIEESQSPIMRTRRVDPALTRSPDFDPFTSATVY
jgi:hypothetical protein